MLAGFSVRGDRWKTKGDAAGFLGFFSLLYLAYVSAIPSHTHTENGWIGDPLTPVSFLWQMWKHRSDPVLHIDLRRWADLMLVAPLDANTLGKVASGICDNLLVSDSWRLSVLSSFAPSLLSCRVHCTKKSVTMDVGCQAAPPPPRYYEMQVC